MEPEKIRILLVAAPDKLDKEAKKLALPLPVARDIRVQAMNLILGRCVLCSKPTLVGMCASCRKNAPQRRRIPWHSISLLKMMKPSDQLLRQVCDGCGRTFMLSAGYLLRRLLSKQENTKKTCNRCIQEAERLKLRLEYQKKKEEEQRKLEKRKKAIEEERKKKAVLARRLEERSLKLSYRPFSGSRELEKLRRELPKTPKRQKASKRAK